MNKRLTLRRRLSYNTDCNKRRIVRTPGGRLIYHYFHYTKKKRQVPKCGGCKLKLSGITPTTSRELARLSRRHKMVKRVYCHACVKQRILKAFLTEEERILHTLQLLHSTSTS